MCVTELHIITLLAPKNSEMAFSLLVNFRTTDADYRQLKSLHQLVTPFGLIGFYQIFREICRLTVQAKRNAVYVWYYNLKP